MLGVDHGLEVWLLYTHKPKKALHYRLLVEFKLW